MPYQELLAVCTLQVFLAIGCSFNPAGLGADVDASGVGDANDGVDAADAVAGCQWQAANFEACDLVAPMGALELLDASGDYEYNTDTGELRDPVGELVPQANEVLAYMEPMTRVTVVDGLTLGPDAEILVIGSHPLVIASWTEIDIQGIIDVGAELARPQLPAGHSPDPLCAAPNAAQPGESGSGGAGGGGGGGFAGPGGHGGDGNNDGTTRDGGMGGAMVEPPMTPRGGCPGADGGEGTAGGIPGGAVQLSARDLIRIRDDGAVDGRGSGGEGAASGDRGGGGGGSGGWLGLDAPTIELSGNAVVAANGGGGGAGSSGNAGGDGEDGTMTETRSSGGVPPGDATGGAEGGAGASVDGGDVTTIRRGGGGGGGGAAGYVIVWGNLSVIDAAVVSPTPTQETP